MGFKWAHMRANPFLRVCVHESAIARKLSRFAIYPHTGRFTTSAFLHFHAVAQKQRALRTGKPEANSHKPHLKVDLAHLVAPAPRHADRTVVALVVRQPELLQLEACLTGYMFPDAAEPPLAFIQADEVCRYVACWFVGAIDPPTDKNGAAQQCFLF